MSSQERILKNQGKKQAKAWLDAIEGRLEAFDSALRRSDTKELQLTLDMMGSSVYLDRLRRATKDEAWLGLLQEIADMPPTPESYYKTCSAELQYRAIEVGPGLLRSCQPRLQDLRQLAGEGLEQVVNLREESKQSGDFCAGLGLRYLYLSVPDREVPTVAQVEEFFSFSQGGKTLVHCLAGRGRTGIFAACYRIRHGMEVEQAIRVTESEVQPMRPHQREWIRAFATT